MGQKDVSMRRDLGPFLCNFSPCRAVKGPAAAVNPRTAHNRIPESLDLGVFQVSAMSQQFLCSPGVVHILQGKSGPVPLILLCIKGDFVVSRYHNFHWMGQLSEESIEVSDFVRTADHGKVASVQ